MIPPHKSIVKVTIKYNFLFTVYHIYYSSHNSQPALLVVLHVTLRHYASLALTQVLLTVQEMLVTYAPALCLDVMNYSTHSQIVSLVSHNCA